MTRRPVTAVMSVLVAVLLTGSGCGGDTGGDGPAPGAAASSPAEPDQAPMLTAEPAGRVRLLPTGAPEGIVVDPASGVIAVALRDPDRIVLIDPASGQLRTQPMPGSARHLVLSQPGELLLPAEDVGLLVEVELPDGAITTSVLVGKQPHDAARLGETVFVSNELGRSVGVVRNEQMITTLPGPIQPGGVGATAGRVAVADVVGNQLYVYDAGTLQQVAVLPAGSGPSHVRPLSEGLVVVADTRGTAVLIYDLRGQPRQVGRIAVPGQPYGLATDPQQGRAYVTLADTNQAVALQVQADGSGSVQTTGPVPTVRQPNSVAYDPRTDTVLVTGVVGSELQTIPAAAFRPR
ncbi:MAG TPA: YncE family protein [Pseudonocardiaceae bacterium]|nr:YncE family protein [Pseudonocardiaceae bacterium]